MRKPFWSVKGRVRFRLTSSPFGTGGSTSPCMPHVSQPNTYFSSPPHKQTRGCVGVWGFWGGLPPKHTCCLWLLSGSRASVECVTWKGFYGDQKKRDNHRFQISRSEESREIPQRKVRTQKTNDEHQNATNTRSKPRQ